MTDRSCLRDPNCCRDGGSVQDYSSRSLPTRGDVSQSLDQTQVLCKNALHSKTICKAIWSRSENRYARPTSYSTLTLSRLQSASGSTCKHSAGARVLSEALGSTLPTPECFRKHSPDIRVFGSTWKDSAGTRVLSEAFGRTLPAPE